MTGAVWGELHAHSHFSLLDGASHPDDLAAQAATLGYTHLALTDHDSLAGLIAHTAACSNLGIIPIAGTELTLDDGSHLTLLARDEHGYRSLCRAISLAQLAGSKGDPQMSMDLLSRCGIGLECLTGCRNGRVQKLLLAGDEAGAAHTLDDLSSIFGSAHVWLEVQMSHVVDDRKLAYAQEKLARKVGIGLAATSNVHYATPEERELQDILVCIKNRVPLAKARPFVRQGASWHLRSLDDMSLLFRHLPIALDGTREILERCRFDMSHIDSRLPEPVSMPANQTPVDYLYALVATGALERYGAESTLGPVGDRLDHELAVIRELGLENYFLIVRDIVRYANVEGIMCQARGSAVGSAVCYCLGISSIEPLSHKLSFERFLASGRTDAPDIDLDFPSERDAGRPGRERVIQYVLKTYSGHAALIANLITYQHRSAIRDVGMALGLDRETIGTLAKEQERWGRQDTTLQLPKEMHESPTTRKIHQLCDKLHGMPRHLGQHPGGIVITHRPLCDVAPIERARMENRIIVQWDKEYAESAGLIKTDHLGLGMLAVIDEAFDYIAQQTGERPSLHSFRCDDSAVYDMFCRADTIGVFQLESRAQMTACLPRLQPRTLSDLAAAVALIRPGPIQGNATNPYLRRRQGMESVTYPGGEAGRRLLGPVLGDTYGVCLYQDQVVDLAIAAGMSQAEAAEIRRAMGSRRSTSRMIALQGRLEAKLIAHGLDESARTEVIAMMTSFSGYGFVRGHSFAFGYLAYISCWLKKYWPGQFVASLLNSQPMGFYPADYLIQDASRHGVSILPVSVRYSRARWTVEGSVVRVGLRSVQGVGDKAARRIEASMQRSFPPSTLDGLCRQANLNEKEVSALARAGALSDIEKNRRTALWRAPAAARMSHQNLLPGFADGAEQPVDLPELSPQEDLMLDYKALGFSANQHVMEYVRPSLEHLNLLTSKNIGAAPRGRLVNVAGQVIARQRPGTAKGTTFISLSDEWGIINIVVTPDIFDAYRSVIRGEVLLLIRGTIGRRHGIVSVQAQSAQPLLQSPTLNVRRGKEFC